MRWLLMKVVRWVKHDKTWSLDPEVTLFAFLVMISNSVWKGARGMVFGLGLRRRRGLLLVGSHVRLRNKGYISTGRAVVIEDYAEIQGLSSRGIVLGNRVSIGSFAMIRPSGYYSGHIGEGLTVGDRSTIGPFCYLGCSGHITIGRNVMIGPRVSFYAENHRFADVSVPMQRQGVSRQPIVIGDDCWIASHSVILAGVTVGHGSIVAAGSVVTRDVPSFSVVGGAPARIIKSRLTEENTPTQRLPVPSQYASSPSVPIGTDYLNS